MWRNRSTDKFVRELLGTHVKDIGKEIDSVLRGQATRLEIVLGVVRQPGTKVVHKTGSLM